MSAESNSEGLTQVLQSVVHGEKVENFPQRVWILFLYGAFLGGLLPVISIVLPAWKFASNAEGNKSELSDWGFSVLSAIILLAVGLAAIIISWRICDSRPRRATALLYGSALIYLVSLTILIRSTGGPILSPLDFFFLYLPVVVAISFPGLRAPVCVALISVACYLLLLLGMGPPDIIGTALVAEETWHKSAHFLMFIWQLALVILIERKVERLPAH